MVEAIRTLNRNGSDVLIKYREIDQPPLSNIERMIGLYPRWHQEALTPNEIGKLTWYFDKTNPRHVSWKLTNDGNARQVEQVARTYLSLGPEALSSEWNEVRKIESMIVYLKDKKKFPPIIIVKGSRYPDSPECSFVDGVHRSLAFMVYALTAPDEKLEIDAYVGRKASLLTRATKRFVQFTNQPFEQI